MFDSAYKAYNNLKLPNVEEPQKKDTAMAGLLSRTQPMPQKANTEVDDERTRVGRYVAQIRAKREALKNG
jgi:hypothetical protein